MRKLDSRKKKEVYTPTKIDIEYFRKLCEKALRDKNFKAKVRKNNGQT